MSGRKMRKRTDSSSSSSSSTPLSKEPISCSSELPGSSQSSGSKPTAPIVQSLKSNSSKYEPMSFNQEKTKSSQSSGSKPTAPIVQSLKSNSSKYEPMSFNQEKTKSSQSSGSKPTAPIVQSLKSNSSKYEPMSFNQEKTKSSQSSGSKPTAPIVQSLKSNSSKYEPMSFNLEVTKSESSQCSVCENVSTDLVKHFCGHWSCKACSSLDNTCPTCGKKPKNVSDDDHQWEAQKRFKKAMKEKYRSTHEGNGDERTSLESIYTTVHITTGESEEISEEHEFRHLQRKPKAQSSSDRTVNICNIFIPLTEQEKVHRTVLTKGVAGIGKSIFVQKFILDWAEEKENQDVDFIFSLSFRELNLIKEDKSLHNLLLELHPAAHHLKDSEDYIKTKIVVILDGLDESRLQLDFENHNTVTSIMDVTSVGNLLVNLIKGELLPDANLWITSRPAAASQIPADCVQMVTEIRGFNDLQKEEYFRKRFEKDSDLAERIRSHIQSSPTLDIMCQIPIFCWISATSFQEVFRGDKESEIPQTLTEMMGHFLLTQTKRRSRKYDKMSERNKETLLKRHKEFLLKLGKLAFVQLQENKLIFYQEDLELCGIDVEEASVYSGFCNTILREEKVFSQKKVFFFVHLTIQEFFAAVYVHECFTTKNKDLGGFLTLKEEHSLLDLLKMTVEKVLEKKNGHLDFFLRFLLGLMVEPNWRVLQGLLTPQDPNDDTDKKILTYLRSIRRKALSPDSCINVFQAMVEMRDNKVKDEIQEYLKQADGSERGLTPLHCSALAYLLQVSKNELEELDLKSYNASEEGRRRLIPAVRSSKKANLSNCKVTSEWMEHLAFGLKFPFSPLRHLDLSNNDLADKGVEVLCGGLSNQCCKLQTLRLSGCMVTEVGCHHLVSALQSNPSHLIELDLSYNHPADSGGKQLSELVNDQRYGLRKLNCDHGGSHRLKPGFKKYSCVPTLDVNTAHKNLRLTDGKMKVMWVEEEQSYPDRPERFDHLLQVLCEQGLKERCYFEVEKEEPFSFGLTYKSIGRKGDADDCRLGHNDESWCATCSEKGCYVWHGGKSVTVSSLCLRCNRLGVYLDWEAGMLSFYRVSHDSRTLLYTFKEVFGEALYPAVELHPHCSARFCHMT